MEPEQDDRRVSAASLQFSGSEPAVREPLTGKAASRDNSGQPEPAACEPLRIVIADDNVDAALTLAALLSMHGHHVCTAHDGLQALDEVMRFEPHVVILDIGMPGMNGYKVASTLRQAELDVLIIAVTGWGQEEDRQRSKAAGFDHHLVKPVELGLLIDLLASPAARRTIH
jgi:CheY-like chemotaxis protein